MKLSDKHNHKFIEEVSLNGWNVETENGFKPIISSNKTIEYIIYEIILEDNLSLKCADTHILIKDNYDEIYAKDSLNSYIRTKKGNKKVISIEKLDYSENMYDLSIDSEEHTYYTNDILSHNSISISIYLLWKAITTPNINIGIAANVLKLAAEVLDKIKKIYIELPIWLQPGLISWNKQSIEFDNGTKIMTAATNGDSFRGYSIHILYCSHENETVTVKNKITQEINIITLKELNIKLKNNKYKILTKDGFKNFNGLLQSKNKEYVELNFIDGTSFKCSKDHKVLKDSIYINVLKLKEKDIISNKIISSIKIIKSINEEIFYDPINVEDNSSYICSNIDSHNCDETAFIRPTIWEEFSDAIFPAQEALANKQTILSSTAGGLNHWYHLVEGARKGINGYKIAEASWKEVPRWNKDGSLKEPEVFMKEQIAKNGQLFWNQNFGNEFLGSSSTLINGTTLKNIDFMQDDDIIFNSLFEGLRIFEEPLENHHYILTSDPKQDGIDRIGLHVIDVTSIPFKQVAAANLKESFFIIPSRVYDLGTYYNNAMVVQENNVEASLINILHDQLEYEGDIFRERKSNGKGFKNILGIRTTSKTKKMMTSFLKKFIEQNMLIINDKHTLDELFNFIEKKNGTFSAEEGYHDDLIMSLSLVFAPFFDIKNWDNFKGFMDIIEKKNKEIEELEQDTAEFLDLGFAPDDDINNSPFTEGIWDNDGFGPSAMDVWNQDINH